MPSLSRHHSSAARHHHPSTPTTSTSLAFTCTTRALPPRFVGAGVRLPGADVSTTDTSTGGTVSSVALAAREKRGKESFQPRPFFDGDGLPFFGGSEATAAVATSFVAASKFGAWGESAARAARVPRDDELESSSARAAGGGGVVAAGIGARRGGAGSGDAGASGEAGSSMMTSVTTSSSLLARRLRRSGVGRSDRSGVGRSGRSGVGRSAETTATGAAGAFSGAGDAATSKSVMATMSSLQGFDPGVRGLALPGVLGVLARSADFGESPSTLES